MIDKYIQKLFRKLGYVRFSRAKEELFEAAALSFTDNKIVVVKGEIWNFKIQVIKPWEKIDIFQ